MTRPVPHGWKEERLGKHIQEISVRNNDTLNAQVLSVTNTQGFVLSEDYFDKQVFSKNLTNYKVVARGQLAYNPSRLNVGSFEGFGLWASKPYVCCL
jgi:type I restriction enzyme, S subunit